MYERQISVHPQKLSTKPLLPKACVMLESSDLSMLWLPHCYNADFLAILVCNYLQLWLLFCISEQYLRSATRLLGSKSSLLYLLGLWTLRITWFSVTISFTFYKRNLNYLNLNVLTGYCAKLVNSVLWWACRGLRTACGSQFTPPHVSGVWKSDCQGWWQVPLPTEPSCQSYILWVWVFCLHIPVHHMHVMSFKARGH